MARERLDAARDALSEPNLRRLNLAYAVTQLGSWAAFIAVSVYAFAHGGAREVGLMTAVRLAPTMIAAPFAGLLADRYARRHVIIGVELTRALAQTLAALLVLEHSAPVGVYLAAALASLADTGVDPARAALLASLARTPQQLTAANALEASVDGAALTLGPAAGALLLSVSSVQVVLFASTGAAIAAALLVARIDVEPLGQALVSGFRQIVGQSLAGFETIARDQTLRVVVGLFAAQMLAFGLLLVFVVAIPLQELHTSASGVGWLNAAAGVGAICGGLLTVTLTGAGLTRPLVIGMTLISLGYALVAAFAVEPIAFAALLTMNLGACYVDVATFTLLQRAVPQDVLARAFSVVQTVIVTALLAGGLIAPALISALGLRGALAVTAVAVLACIGCAYPALRRIDASAGAPLEPLKVLRKLALFRMLPAPVLERLAAGLLEREATRGEEVVTQGRPADGYYVVRAGSAEVLVDAARVATLGPGDGFGELALLLDSPRAATVRALEHMQLGYLDRELFLATVSGNDESRQAGSALAQALLGRSSPAGSLM